MPMRPVKKCFNAHRRVRGHAHTEESIVPPSPLVGKGKTPAVSLRWVSQVSAYKNSNRECAPAKEEQLDGTADLDGDGAQSGAPSARSVGVIYDGAGHHRCRRSGRGRLTLHSECRPRPVRLRPPHRGRASFDSTLVGRSHAADRDGCGECDRGALRLMVSSTSPVYRYYRTATSF